MSPHSIVCRNRRQNLMYTRFTHLNSLLPSDSSIQVDANSVVEELLIPRSAILQISKRDAASVQIRNQESRCDRTLLVAVKHCSAVTFYPTISWSLRSSTFVTVWTLRLCVGWFKERGCTRRDWGEQTRVRPFYPWKSSLRTVFFIDDIHRGASESPLQLLSTDDCDRCCTRVWERDRIITSVDGSLSILWRQGNGVEF